MEAKFHEREIKEIKEIKEFEVVKVRIKHIDKNHLIPTKCDYLGRHSNFRTVVITLPYDQKYGIQCIPELKPFARQDIYDYCLEHDIYPVTQKVLEDCDLFDRHFTIRRSSGEIETNWRIMDSKTTFVRNNFLRPEYNGKLMIWIHNRDGEVMKPIPINDLFDLNREIEEEYCHRKIFIDALKYSLDNWFEQRINLMQDNRICRICDNL
jgi:hypothetical protein